MKNLWDSAKEVVRGMFRAIQRYTKKQEKSQPKLLYKGIRKRRKNKAQSQQKEKNNKLIKVRDEIGTKNFFNVNEAKSWFFEKINKIWDISQVHQEKEREASNKQNNKLKKRNNNWYHRHIKITRE